MLKIERKVDVGLEAKVHECKQDCQNTCVWTSFVGALGFGCSLSGTEHRRAVVPFRGALSVGS